MGGPATNTIGNLSLVAVLNATLSPTSVAPAVSAEQTFTVKGIHLGDYVAVSNSGAAQSGLVVTNSRVTADSTLGITFGNLSAATITPTSATVYTVFVARYENWPETGSAPIGISA